MQFPHDPTTNTALAGSVSSRSILEHQDHAVILTRVRIAGDPSNENPPGSQLFRATDMRNEQSLIESDSYFSDVWANAQRSRSGFLRRWILGRWQRLSDTRRESLV